MKKVLLLGLLIVGGLIWFNNQNPVPQFTDVENEVICLEEGI